MWIALGIVIFLALLITVVLLLPVSVIIKTIDGELVLRYKILHKTFGEEPDPDSSIVKALKEITGAAQLDKQKIKTSSQEKGLSSTVSETLNILIGLVKAVLELLKHATVKKLKLNIVCTGEDAADVALSYGRCCAFVSSALGFLSSYMRIKKRGRDIRVSCDFDEEKKGVFELEIVLVLRLFRVLAALIKRAVKEVERAEKAKETGKTDQQRES